MYICVSLSLSLLYVSVPLCVCLSLHLSLSVPLYLFLSYCVCVFVIPCFGVFSVGYLNQGLGTGYSKRWLNSPYSTKMSQDPKINFEFSKTGISITTAEYLIDKANTKELKDSIQKIFTEGHLKVKEANLLLNAILEAYQ